jgi:hypothetical protein
MNTKWFPLFGLILGATEPDACDADADGQRDRGRSRRERHGDGPGADFDALTRHLARAPLRDVLFGIRN